MDIEIQMDAPLTAYTRFKSVILLKPRNELIVLTGETFGLVYALKRNGEIKTVRTKGVEKDEETGDLEDNRKNNN